MGARALASLEVTAHNNCAKEAGTQVKCYLIPLNLIPPDSVLYSKLFKFFPFVCSFLSPLASKQFATDTTELPATQHNQTHVCFTPSHHQVSKPWRRKHSSTSSSVRKTLQESIEKNCLAD